jgi:hypothetical protein
MKKLAKKAANFMGIKGVELYGVVYEFSQNSDSCQSPDDGQSIKVFTEDAGGGSYIVFSTERWAIDAEDIDKFAETLKRIVNMPEER